jgi:hypothetical protein
MELLAVSPGVVGGKTGILSTWCLIAPPSLLSGRIAKNDLAEEITKKTPLKVYNKFFIRRTV